MLAASTTTSMMADSVQIIALRSSLCECEVRFAFSIGSVRGLAALSICVHWSICVQCKSEGKLVHTPMLSAHIHSLFSMRFFYWACAIYPVMSESFILVNDTNSHAYTHTHTHFIHLLFQASPSPDICSLGDFVPIRLIRMRRFFLRA